MKNNQNAARSGLYSNRPAVRAIDLLLKPEATDLLRMAELSRDLADAALTIAQGLGQAAEEGALDPESVSVVVLYAEVATELSEMEAVLAGATGIKPAALGRLTDEGYERLLRAQVGALELAFSQVISATKHLLTRQEVGGEGLVVGVKRDASGAIMRAGELDPILTSLANKLRAVKRMMKRLAGIIQWRQARSEGGDLADIFLSNEEGDGN